jgi:anaerobic selenocysteine-containing dehydrogenase
MSMVHLSGGINAPADPGLLSEPAIVARLAEAALGDRTKVQWRWLAEDYDRIRDLVARVFHDFHDFNERVRVPGGFRLSNGARDRRWNTADGRAGFKAHPVPVNTPAHRARTVRAGQPVFVLSTVRSHDQYNTTIYGLDDRYRGVSGERRVLFANADDIAALGMAAGDRVDLESLGEDGVQRTAKDFLLVAYDIPRGCLAGYYPETNALVPLSSFAERARTPTSKSIPVVVHPHRPDTSARGPSQRDIPAAVIR